MPSWVEAVKVKGPPEPKSRVRVQRTPKLSFGRPEAGAFVPQFWSIAVSQSVRFGVPEKAVFAKNCRLKTGDAQDTAADAGAVESRVPAVASTTVAAAAAVVRLAGFIRSSGRLRDSGGRRPHLDPRGMGLVVRILVARRIKVW